MFSADLGGVIEVTTITGQIAYTTPGASIPAGLQWKTLTKGPNHVFVDMTAALDAGIFAAAEAHRVAMEASPTPHNYDFSSGWPVSFETAD